LLIIGPNLLFHSPAQPTANSPKSIFHIIKMSHHASVLLSVHETYRNVGFLKIKIKSSIDLKLANEILLPVQETV
jgi:hypothetical protein